MREGKVTEDDSGQYKQPVDDSSSDEEQSLVGLSNLAADSKEGLQIVAEVQQFLEGPLPHPDFAERYEHALPGSLDRILGMAEQQQQSRLQLEERHHAHQITQEIRRHDAAVEFQKRILESYNRREYTGMILGFVLALCVLGIATLVIATGRSLEAGVALIIADAAVVAGVFLVARKRGDDEPPTR